MARSTIPELAGERISNMLAFLLLRTTGGKVDATADIEYNTVLRVVKVLGFDDGVRDKLQRDAYRLAGLPFDEAEAAAREG